MTEAAATARKRPHRIVGRSLCPSLTRGSLIRASLTCGSLACLATALLGGCSQGVLDPKGPIAVAEKTILFDSLGIMLAIVIPTILATLAVAFWFRASNSRARHLPEWDYSGRLEMLVWSIPAMTVMLLGGIAWI